MLRTSVAVSGTRRWTTRKQSEHIALSRSFPTGHRRTQGCALGAKLVQELERGAYLGQFRLLGYLAIKGGRQVRGSAGSEGETHGFTQGHDRPTPTAGVIYRQLKLMLELPEVE